MHSRRRIVFVRIVVPSLLLLALLFAGVEGFLSFHQAHASNSVVQTFDQASQEFQVPSSLLKALCYMEGRLSNHNGTPSIDDGYGCMHLVKNRQGDTLDRAAKDLGVSANQLKQDLPTNIRGGAAILRDDALQISPTHTLPTSLSDWYGAIAAYSNAATRSTALLYADGVYSILNSGFSDVADTGETVTLTPQAVQPNTLTANSIKGASSLPAGCTKDNKVDYPGAIDCILNPQTYDCNLVSSNAPCNYDDASRAANTPNNCNPPSANTCAINQIVIHDVEGTAKDALNAFQDPNNYVSAHYIVASNGTIYQVVHDKDIAFQAGNFWYNEHSIGIEHAGFDSTGYKWYNATEYLASAKLVAYLLRKYQIPLDHDHIVSHGTIPSPFLAVAPNHVDPGPYWLWDYYLKLIHKQGVPYSQSNFTSGIITLHPTTDQHPFGTGGKETSKNFNFFYLYNGPSTTSGLIPQEGTPSDITDVTNNIEPDISYYYVAKAKDSAGTGDTMYEIWYGEEDQAHASSPSFFAHGKLAWLAVPTNDAVEGDGIIVVLKTSDGSRPQVYGRPTTNSQYIIGDIADNAHVISAYSIVEDQTNNLWYEINYNHRQAWVPTNEVVR